MVSLGYQDQESNSWNHLCEGSILSNRTIATSGDCVELFNEDMIIKDVETKNVKTKDVETMDVETKDVETKLQIRVGDEELEDDDDDDNVKVYFADGFRKHDSNVALIATNKTIEFEKDKTDKIGIQQFCSLGGVFITTLFTSKQVSFTKMIKFQLPSSGNFKVKVETKIDLQL